MRTAIAAACPPGGGGRIAAMPLLPARLDFKPDGTPYSAAYDDIYHTAHGGPAQARHVFLGGNDLPARWQGRDRLVILETGFGLGLNFLATWQAWRDDPQRCRRLHFVSLEKHPFTASDLAVAHQAWPGFADLAATLRQPMTERLLKSAERLMMQEKNPDKIRIIETITQAWVEQRKVRIEYQALGSDGFTRHTISPYIIEPSIWTDGVYVIARSDFNDQLFAFLVFHL